MDFQNSEPRSILLFFFFSLQHLLINFSMFFYDKKTLKNLLISVAKKRKRKVEWIEVHYFGNPLPSEFPKSIICTLGRLINFIFPKNRFLILTICKLKR